MTIVNVDRIGPNGRVWGSISTLSYSRNSQNRQKYYRSARHRTSDNLTPLHPLFNCVAIFFIEGLGSGKSDKIIICLTSKMQTRILRNWVIEFKFSWLGKMHISLIALINYLQLCHMIKYSSCRSPCTLWMFPYLISSKLQLTLFTQRRLWLKHLLDVIIDTEF